MDTRQALLELAAATSFPIYPSARALFRYGTRMSAIERDYELATIRLNLQQINIAWAAVEAAEVAARAPMLRDAS